MDLREVSHIPKQHGQKRHGDDTIDHEQRLSKRFNLLNLDNHNKLYIPVQHVPRSPSLRRSRSNAFSDSMNLDDSRDRVYIHNLDDEISDVESEEDKLVFLPDIDKHFTKVPKSVLMMHSEPQTSSEVVLYSIPESISVPREHDNVRKAIIESRARVREKQVTEASTAQCQKSQKFEAEHRFQRNPPHLPVEIGGDTYDPDAMEIG